MNRILKSAGCSHHDCTCEICIQLRTPGLISQNSAMIRDLRRARALTSEAEDAPKTVLEVFVPSTTSQQHTIVSSPVLWRDRVVLVEVATVTMRSTTLGGRPDFSFGDVELVSIGRISWCSCKLFVAATVCRHISFLLNYLLELDIDAACLNTSIMKCSSCCQRANPWFTAADINRYGEELIKLYEAAPLLLVVGSGVDPTASVVASQAASQDAMSDTQMFAEVVARLTAPDVPSVL